MLNVHNAPRPRGASSTPRVIVLLAAHNGELWIEEQIRSILAQDDVETSVVVRDDASTDRTLAIVKTLETTGRVIVASAASPSGSAAQNFFALIREQAGESADFVAFADQDDVWLPQKLSRACAALCAGAAAGYSSAVTAVWEDGRTRVLRQEPRQTSADFIFEGAGQGCTFVLDISFYRRMRDFLIQNAQLTAPIHFHDWATYALARVWGLRWVFDAWPSVRYRQHASNQIGAQFSAKGFSKRIELIRSGWYKHEIRAITELCIQAAPQTRLVHEWRGVLERSDGLLRRLSTAQLLATRSRRKRLERAILGLGALAGWL